MSGQMMMRESYNDGTSINNLPTEQQLPDYNKMYGGQQTPLVDAANPGGQMMMGPMAANEALGGSFGGSSW
jgi:hypothetical protein